MSSPSRWLFCLGLLLGLGACGGVGDRDGYTYCGDFLGTTYCQPGQYCVDPTFSECVPGCTSDTNCAPNQICRKVDRQQVGTCVNRCSSCSGSH
jgi:hypothetical protein